MNEPLRGMFLGRRGSKKGGGDIWYQRRLFFISSFSVWFLSVVIFEFCFCLCVYVFTPPHLLSFSPSLPHAGRANFILLF